MEITWYGTAALVLRAGGAAIAFDPFCGLPIEKTAPTALPWAKELAAVRDVFITHGHFDHVLHIPALYKDAQLRLRCTPAPAKTLIAKGVPQEQIHLIAPGHSEKTGPFSVTAYQSRHCKFDLPLIFRTVFRRAFFRRPGQLFRLLRTNLQYPEKGEILFYEVTCGDTRIQILGSLNLAPDVTYPTGADLLVLPYQGRSDLEEYSLKLVRRLQPKAVLLDHFDDAFPPMSSAVDTTKFETILQQEHIPCCVPVKGEPIYYA